MLPDFCVIGAQKAGSTYLLQCLGEHPDVFMPGAEVDFFQPGDETPERIAWFERHFEHAQPGQTLGVKRPNLLGQPGCAERINNLLPNAKLIVILRHPIQRAMSGYFHYMKTGLLPICDAETGFRKLLSGEYASLPRAGEVLSFGRYAEHLKRYEQYFDKSQLHITLLDDVKQNSQQELSKIFSFLGVQEDFIPQAIRGRPMAAPYSLTRLRLWDALDRLQREKSDRQYLKRKTDTFHRSLHAANVLLDKHLWARLFPAQPPRLSKSLTSDLKDYYSQDMRALQELLGKSRACWPDLEPSLLPEKPAR